MGPTYEQAVSAWAAHLRSGGTSTWSTWRRDHGTDRLDAPLLHPLPFAHQLELLRRLNLTAARGIGEAGERLPGPVLEDLADRVLAASTPGRGLIDVPLPWEARPPWGTPAQEPDLLPAEELVRLAAGVLAHRLRALPPPQEPDTAQRWPLPWRRRFRLHGSPGTVSVVRSALLEQGLVETGLGATHIVVARPVEVMMAEHWAAAVRRGQVLQWGRLWRRARAVDALPPSIAVASIADRLQARLHRRRGEPLHVVVATDAAEVVHHVTRVLGARAFDLPPSTDVALPDLLRQVNRLTGLLGGPARVRPVSRTLLGALDAPALHQVDPHTDGFLTPRVMLPWAREVAATTADRLRAAGYPVHGDPGALAPTEHDLAGTVDRNLTLELALTACLRTWQLGGAP